MDIQIQAAYRALYWQIIGRQWLIPRTFDPKHTFFLPLGLYKILFHFEALLHNNTFCKPPLIVIVQYIAQYYQLPVIVIAPPRPMLSCF